MSGLVDRFGRVARDLRISVTGKCSLRFTGGEPLVPADLEEIIAKSAAVAADASISMTTNGTGLDERIDGLAAAGLARINISLDTVDRDHFARLTRRDRLPAVFQRIEAAKRAGMTPLKINAVLMRDTLRGAADLVAWALANDVALRFIEQMPLDADGTWARDNVVDASELVEYRSQWQPTGRWNVGSHPRTVA